MNHFNIILPFGIPPKTLAKEMAKQLNMPALAQLLALSNQTEHVSFEEYARLLPHEALLSGKYLLCDLANNLQQQADTDERSNSPAITHNTMQAMGKLRSEGFWFTINPVHIHVASDHLVVTDQRRLAISNEESLTLFNAAKEMCDELGKTLIYGDAKNWFLRADDWHELKTASLDAASGHNIDIWIAEGDKAKEWRKLQNEIQMIWHISPINEQRAERGDALINSVWLHSGSAGLNANMLPVFYEWQNKEQASNSHNNLLINALSEAAMNSDWHTWLMHMQAIDQSTFAPVLAELISGKIETIKLIVTDTHRLVHYHIQRKTPWKFWQRFTQTPSLAALFNIT